MMQIIDLKISGYRIRFENADSLITLRLHPKFNRFIKNFNDDDFDIRIRVSSGRSDLPPGSACIFNGSYFGEETDKSLPTDFWSIWRSPESLHAMACFDRMDPGNKAILNFSTTGNEWSLKVGTKATVVDPMRYPLDGLIIYYLAMMHRDIFIHASGVVHDGKGYVFSGVSGKGKSTMAELWKQKGAEIIHDDRLVIRKKGSVFVMHNTPVYENDYPKEAVVSRIYLIEHGKENRSERLKGAASVTSVMVNCIQHNWGQETIRMLLESVNDLCNEVPVYRLSFKPDQEVTEKIS